MGLAVGILAGPAEVAIDIYLIAPRLFDLNTVIPVGLVFGIWTAVAAGTTSTIAVGLSLVGLAALRRPSRLVLRLDRLFLQRFLIGAVLIGALTGFAVTLSLAFLLAVSALSMTGLLVVAGAVLALVVPTGLGFGLVFGLVRPSEQPPAPASSLASSRLVSVITLLAAILSFGLVAAGRGLLSGSPSALLEGIGAGLLLGVPIALGLAAVLPWSAYQLAHLRLALRGRLPWRSARPLPAPFLPTADTEACLDQLIDVGSPYGRSAARHPPHPQILAAFMADLARDDWYGRALSQHTGLGSGTVLQCLYRLEQWGWLESRWEDKDLATRDGRPPRRFYQLTGLGQREAVALLDQRFAGQLRFAPGGGLG